MMLKHMIMITRTGVTAIHTYSITLRVFTPDDFSNSLLNYILYIINLIHIIRCTTLQIWFIIIKCTYDRFRAPKNHKTVTTSNAPIIATDWTHVYQSNNLYKYIPPLYIFGIVRKNSTKQTTKATVSRPNFFVFILSIIVWFTTSTDENTESIPSKNKLKKKRIDHNNVGCIDDSACGYEINTSSRPSVFKSGIAIPVISEIWPRTENIINPAKIDVALNWLCY